LPTSGSIVVSPSQSSDYVVSCQLGTEPAVFDTATVTIVPATGTGTGTGGSGTGTGGGGTDGGTSAGDGNGTGNSGDSGLGDEAGQGALSLWWLLLLSLLLIKAPLIQSRRSIQS
jgi:hypothetical protein